MMHRSMPWIVRLAWLATAFTLVVIVFGAFVRLSNAGLSCPDWPTCYGRVTWPDHHAAIVTADQAFPGRPVETHKTWREQGHRMLASILGSMVLAVALLAVWKRKLLRMAVIIAALSAAMGVGFYIVGERVIAGLLAILAIGLPLGAAWRLDSSVPRSILVVAFAMIVFQAMLGMWTVTLLLKPAVVMGHLLGGLTLFSLLGYAALRLSGVAASGELPRRLLPWVVIGLLLLVGQIALGGWTSANYAALACGTEFPKCAGAWWPATDFHQGFILWREIGVNYAGGMLDEPARAAIQMTHRFGALLVFTYGLWLAWRARQSGLRRQAWVLVLLLLAQVALGISNVLLGLPLLVATGHNAGAALLLFTLLWLLASTQRGLPENS